jgi:hypothetical protein
LALVANCFDWVRDSESWKDVPDNKVHVIDLTASPPTQIGMIEAGKQASGMAVSRARTLEVAITPDGKTALVVKGGANRVELLDIAWQ